jgi:hypothetical protein
MGRLDKTIHARDELFDESELDELDELEPVDDLLGKNDMEDMVLIEKSMDKSMDKPSGQKMSACISRRMLEDRLEEFRLQHQLNDYDFKV